MSTKKPGAPQAHPTVQLKDWVFNTAGHGFVAPIQFSNQIILAYDVNSTHMTNAIGQMTTQGVEEPYRESLLLTPRELGEQEPGLFKYIIVGFIPKEFDKKIHGKAASSKQGPPAGTVVPPEPVKVTKIPMMAVVKVTENLQQPLKYWALLKPKDGLCTPYAAGQDRIFFFSSFRSNVGNVKERGGAWSAQVIAAATSFAAVPKPLSEKQKQFQKAKDTTRLVFKPTQAFANEVMFLAAGYEATRERFFLESLKKVLEAAQDDLRFQPLPSYWALRKFMDNSEAMTEEECEQVVGDVGQLWPDLENVNAAAIQELKQGLMQGEVYLGERFLRGFIMLGCHTLKAKEGSKAAEASSTELVELVKDTLYVTEKSLGPLESTASIDTENERSLLVTVLQKVKEIGSSAVDFDAALKDRTGDAVGGATLQDIWAKYAESATTDAAKKSWFQAARYFATELETKEAGVSGMVKALEEQLGKLDLAGKGA